jgi:hypothetical protein
MACLIFSNSLVPRDPGHLCLAGPLIAGIAGNCRFWNASKKVKDLVRLSMTQTSPVVVAQE